MFARLLLLFILVPLVDLMLLFGISKLTHWTTTVAIVVASGILGAWLAQRQSNSVGFKIRDQLAQNNIPSGLLTDGAMILFAAGLLITPGLITDLFGLSLLVPPSRNWYKSKAVKWLKDHFRIQVTKMQGSVFETDVVDGEVVASSDESESDPAKNESQLLQ